VPFLLLGFTIFNFPEGPIHASEKHPNAIKGAMNHTKTSFSAKMKGGAIITVV
jgi:hypothetical protein